MLSELRKKRDRLQFATVAGLPLVIIGGWFFPKIGFFLLACMLGALGIAFYKGRAWCDWMCPRGSFYDVFVKRLSAQRKIPSFFRKKGLRVFVLIMLLSILGTQLYIAWGDLDAMGLAMVRVLTATTVIGIVFGLAYQQRLWCHICPMGTLGNYLSEGKQPLAVSASCVDCKVCAKVCPMQLAPHQFKGQGAAGDNDCIKCATCVAACPKKALSFGMTKAA